MRGVGLLFVVALAMLSVVIGWGLGAVLAAFGFASLYGPKAAQWLNA